MHTQNIQMSLGDIYTDCSHLFDEDKPKFIALLEKHLNISEFIPASFYISFYKRTGRERKYALESFISALVLQKIIGIPTISLLIIVLHFSKDLRDFCGFKSVPDASKFTRFKQDFSDELEKMFNFLVDVTEPICQKINTELASMLVFDTSGIESYVTENNPKFLNRIIRQLKVKYKNNSDIDPYKLAYYCMPSAAASNSEIKQLYSNGHFCYVYKFGLLTNALGIVRHISFLDKEFKSKYPELTDTAKTVSPDEDKSVGDSTALRPVIKDYRKRHPNATFTTFLGDAAFDAVDTYTFLLKDCKFKRALIPMQARNTKLPSPDFNESGHPLCPQDKSLTLQPVGWSNEKGRSLRFKWICPKSKHQNHTRICACENPCTSSTYGRVVYSYPHQNYRLYPGIIRDTEEWDKTYKLRGVIEQTINQFKEHMGVGNIKTQDKRTTKADLLLAGISQLFSVVLADKLQQYQFFRSLRKLMA